MRRRKRYPHAAQKDTGLALCPGARRKQGKNGGASGKNGAAAADNIAAGGEIFRRYLKNAPMGREISSSLSKRR